MSSRQIGNHQILTLTLIVLVGFAVIGAAAIAAGWISAIALLAVLCLNALPALPWAIAWFGRPSSSNPTPLLVGFSLGNVSSLLVIGAAVSYWGWSTWIILSVPLILTIPSCVYLWLQSRKDSCRVGTATFDLTDWSFLAVAILVLLGVLVIPLSRVGQVVGDDHVFYNLFGHDYLGRSALAFELLRGLPPDHLTWTAHGGYYLCYMLTASVSYLTSLAVSSSDNSHPPYQLLGAVSIYLSVIFVLMLTLALKTVFRSRLPCYAALACGLFAYSYNGLYVLVKRLVAPAIPVLGDALSRSGATTFSDLSKGWYRDFLVEQQAVLALIFLFTCFFLVLFLVRGASHAALSVAIGVILAGAFSSDSSIGAIGVLWLAVFLAWQCVTAEHGDRGRVLRIGMTIYGAAAATLGLAWVSCLAPVPSGGSSLFLTLNKLVWLLGPVYLPFDFGPPLLLGIVGVFLAYRYRSELPDGVAPLVATVALAAISLFFIACVKHDGRIEENVILRKAGKVFRFALVIGCGYYFHFLAMKLRSGVRPKHTRLMCAIVLLGVPVLPIDFAVLSGLYNDGRTASISPADYDACEWLRKQTPPSAIVQSLPEYPGGGYEMTPVAVIAGRPMALGNEKVGWSICHAKHRDFDMLKRAVYSLFEPISLDESEDVLRRLGIEYVYVGPHERAWRPGGTDKYYRNPQLFTKVYSRDGVDVFLYRHNTKGYGGRTKGLEPE